MVVIYPVNYFIWATPRRQICAHHASHKDRSKIQVLITTSQVSSFSWYSSVQYSTQSIWLVSSTVSSKITSNSILYNICGLHLVSIALSAIDGQLARTFPSYLLIVASFIKYLISIGLSSPTSWESYIWATSLVTKNVKLQDRGQLIVENGSNPTGGLFLCSSGAKNRFYIFKLLFKPKEYGIQTVCGIQS